MNLEKTIKEASQVLKNNKITSYDLDAHILLSDITSLSKNKNRTPKKPNKTPVDFKIFNFSFDIKK